MRPDGRSRLRMRFASRSACKRLLILFALLAAGAIWAYFVMVRMPGESYRGTLPPLTESQSALSERLRDDVTKLAGQIGRRSVFYSKGLRETEAFLTKSLSDAGYTVRREEFKAIGQPCCNLEVEIKGSRHPDEIVVIGAHYDSVDDSPAANDNGSGVAAVLALARQFGGAPALPERTLRLVLFVNEEPPLFQTQQMGSLIYAQGCRKRNENIVAMLSLETIGYYSDARDSQQYPIAPIGWLYPDVGDFIAFVGNVDSRHLVRQAVESFRANALFPSEGAAMPGWIAGVDWSDHWSFWQAGYPAAMVTDTARFRYPFYHTNQDTPDKLDYDRMARVVEGLGAVIRNLGDAPEE